MSTFKLPSRFLSVDVYKACLDETHFLVKLKDMFAWNAMSAPLEQFARNAEGGRPRTLQSSCSRRYSFRSCSTTPTVRRNSPATSNLYVKYFLGLPIDEKAPDHSTLSRFRDETLKTKGISFFRDLFRSLLSQAKERGIRISVMDALDATHTWANVDTEKPRDPKDAARPRRFMGLQRETKPRRLLTGKRYKSPNTSSGTNSFACRNLPGSHHRIPRNAGECRGHRRRRHANTPHPHERRTKGCRRSLGRQGIWLSCMD